MYTLRRAEAVLLLRCPTVPAHGRPAPAELAEWPVEWRAKWGWLANELQDQGIPWPEHERQAFYQVKAEMEAHHHVFKR
jgi:hypothetical protein